MDEVRLGRLRQIVFERLTLGESHEVLGAELRTKLDEGVAQKILDDAVLQIAAGRSGGTYDAQARQTRKRRFGAEYVAWRVLGWVLIVVGAAGTLSGILTSQTLTVAIGPLVVGIAILGIVDWKVNSRAQAAKEAVDSLFTDEPFLSDETAKY